MPVLSHAFLLCCGEILTYSYYVFDAYGTLFDVHSAVSRHADLVGDDAKRVSEIWRNKQLEYSWTRSAMDRYKSFWVLTQEALDFALASVPTANKAARQKLLDAYMTLECYDEVKPVLAALKRQGAKSAILSNGSPEMLESAVHSSGLENLLDDVFSVHALGIFKTAPKAYQLIVDQWAIEPDQICFLSSNRWDIAGATSFGFNAIWINRTNQVDEYKDLKPIATLKDLNGLLAL